MNDFDDGISQREEKLGILRRGRMLPLREAEMFSVSKGVLVISQQLDTARQCDPPKAICYQMDHVRNKME